MTGTLAGMEREVLGPVRGACPGCGEEVLVVELVLTGRDVVLDPAEVLPTSPCPLCRSVESSGRDAGAWCWRCGGTRVVGEPLPEPGVCIDQHGHARSFRGFRRKGEAVHRPHRCPSDLALAV